MAVLYNKISTLAPDTGRRGMVNCIKPLGDHAISS